MFRSGKDCRFLLNMTIFDKWFNCRHSIILGFGGEDGYALKDEGYYENFGCICQAILNIGRYKVIDTRDGEAFIPVAHLCRIGKKGDQHVIEALTSSCSECQWFEKR